MKGLTFNLGTENAGQIVENIGQLPPRKILNVKMHLGENGSIHKES